MARDNGLPALLPASGASPTGSAEMTPMRRQLCSADGPRPGAADRERRLKIENSRLREELDSLKAMFARRISTDETRFEEQIRIKDEECQRWFKSKKHDISKMQSALVIMRSLFERKRRKFAEDMQAQSDMFDAQKAEWLENIRKLKAETEAEKAAASKELEVKTAEFQEKIKQAKQVNNELDARVKLLEEALADKKSECERLRKEAAELSRTLEQLRQRLLEVERADELLKRNSQIEALEAELKRTKKLMHERAHAEADALRRELMEYVKFIVHILPEEWQSKAKDMADNPNQSPSSTMPSPPRSAPAGGTKGKNPRQKKSAAQQAQNLYQVPSSLHGYAQAMGMGAERIGQQANGEGDDF